METFKVRFCEGLVSDSREPFGVEGFRAPGRLVLVVRGGTWVGREDGTRETAEAQSVVIYDAGDWVEYGSDGSGDAFEAELYGSAGLPGEQQTARLARFLAEASGP
jgi:hypothetical protein